jgi:transcriptional regulator with GAF, ATPase, and Fis domain
MTEKIVPWMYPRALRAPFPIECVQIRHLTTRRVAHAAEGLYGRRALEHEGAFEAIVAEIGEDLLGTPLDAMDTALSQALSRLVACLGIDRAAIAVPEAAGGALSVTHSAGAVGVSRAPIPLSDSELPWVARQLRAHSKLIVLSPETAMCPEAAVDFATLRTHGIEAMALLPVMAGGRLLSVLSFATARSTPSWPSAMVDRLRLIAEILGGAFLRLDHELKQRANLAEAETLRERLQAENAYLREGPLVAEGFDDIVGESPALRAVLFMVEQVAPTDAAVLLLGETGTGKELLARAIHSKSHRRGRALVKVNCAALPPTLIESELFGHEKGAFTGADARKLGRFELADQGTLFLDEIGELPLSLQAKLLRVLQEGEFERLGSTLTRKVDVRMIAACNRDLAAAVREGTFRSDLYYRLAVFPIQVPPLRGRTADIPLLVWHFLGQLGATLGRKIERVPASTMERLVGYAWPGNIRELRNVLERAVILSPGSTLLVNGPADEGPVAGTVVSQAGELPTLVDVERDHILRVLDICAWRIRGRANAAQRLGLNASTLYSRMKKLGIRRGPSGALAGASEPMRRVSAR